MPLVSATIGDDLWRWQVGNRSNPFGGIGSIRTRTAHGCVLLVRMLGPALYDKCPTGAIPKPGKDAMVSYYGLFSLFTPVSGAYHARPPEPGDRSHVGD